MLSLLQRIPSVWIALILSGTCASLYLRYLVAKDPESTFVRERIFSIVFVNIIFSRISGLILHPSANIKEDLLSLLSGASASGWLVGLIASIVYSLLALSRAKHLNQKTLAIFAEAVCSGSLVYFVYQAYTDLNPFRAEDILRTIGAAVLLWLVRRNRAQWSNHAQWLWGGYGLMMILTSTYVPHVNRVLAFATPQWVFLILMVISVYAEAKQDLRVSNRHVQPEVRAGINQIKNSQDPFQ